MQRFVTGLHTQYCVFDEVCPFKWNGGEVPQTPHGGCIYSGYIMKLCSKSPERCMCCIVYFVRVRMMNTLMRHNFSMKYIFIFCHTFIDGI